MNLQSEAAEKEKLRRHKAKVHQAVFELLTFFERRFVHLDQMKAQRAAEEAQKEREQAVSEISEIIEIQEENLKMADSGSDIDLDIAEEEEVATQKILLAEEETTGMAIKQQIPEEGQEIQQDDFQVGNLGRMDVIDLAEEEVATAVEIHAEPEHLLAEATDGNQQIQEERFEIPLEEDFHVADSGSDCDPFPEEDVTKSQEVHAKTGNAITTQQPGSRDNQQQQKSREKIVDSINQDFTVIINN